MWKYFSSVPKNVVFLKLKKTQTKVGDIVNTTFSKGKRKKTLDKTRNVSCFPPLLLI